MTVMPRIPSRKSKRRRSSFVPASSRPNAVPDALSWREQLDASPAPKGPSAWMAASSNQLDRMVIDAGPYGVIDLAAAGAMESDRNQQLGVVWWDKRSFREEDHDDDTIETSFVPASISDHVSLSRPSLPAPALDEPSVWPFTASAPAETAPSRPRSGTPNGGSRRAREHASLPAAATGQWSEPAVERSLADPSVFVPPLAPPAPPVKAARPSE